MSIKKDPIYIVNKEMSSPDERSSLFYELLQNNALGTAIINVNGKIIQYNSYFKQIFNAGQRADLFGHILKFEGNLEVQYAIRSYVVSAALNSSRDFIIQCGPGKVKLSMLCTQVYAESQKIFVVVAQQNESASSLFDLLRNVRSLHKSFTDSSFELVFQCTEEGRIIYFNKLFAEALEYTSQSSVMLQKKIEEILIGDYGLLKAKVDVAGKVVRHQVRLRKEGGTFLRGLANISVYETKSQKRIYNWVILDLTQNAEHEEYIQTMNSELQRVSFQLEKFLYSASHDLRSPITSILGLVNLIKMESGNNDVMDYVDKIESSAKRMDNLIRNLAYLSRISYNPSRYDHVSLSHLFSKVIQAYEFNVQYRNVKFEIINGETDAFFSDEEKLRIIFDQLIRNSITFHDPNKSMRIVQVKLNVTPRKAVVEVLDNGVGIPNQHLKSVFNIFFKATMNSGGSGLGLFIVKEALEKLNGTISIESQVGVGSRVIIEIPNEMREFGIKGHQIFPEQKDVA